MTEQVPTNSALNRDEAVAVQSLLAAVGAVRRNLLLICGGIVWWGSHYLTFWNIGVVSRGAFLNGFDRIWLTSVATTVLVLGFVALLVRKRTGFQLATRRWSYAVIFGCVLLGLAVFFLPSESGIVLPVVGAVLIGIGTSLGHILYGELHSRMGSGFIPVACAIESTLGAVLYGLFFHLPTMVTLPIAMAFVLAAGGCFILYSRSDDSTTSGDAFSIKADINIVQLSILALLIGLTYGFVRTFSSSSIESWPSSALPFEQIGTLLAAVLLIAVFFLQKGRTLLEQCFIFVIPFVATGMLLVPLQRFNSVLPVIINCGGFVCFFMLLWRYAAALAIGNGKQHLAFITASLFFFIQLGQVLGALVPAGFANAFSTEFIYLLLIISIFFFIAQRRKAPKVENATAVLLPDGFVQRFKLSPREAEVLGLLTRRAPYKQIERELFVSANTVKTHVRNIYSKLEVSSREELLEKIDSLAKNG